MKDCTMKKFRKGRKNQTRIFIIAIVTILIAPTVSSAAAKPDNNQINLAAGIVERTIKITAEGVSTTHLRVDGTELLASPANEFTVTFTHANPNRKPKGLTPDSNTIQNPVQWIKPVTVDAAKWSDSFDILTHRFSKPKPGVTHLNIRAQSTKGKLPQGISIDLFYEIYDGHPAIRKWVEITNNSGTWLKIENLIIDDIKLTDNFSHQTLLTPSERGAGSSVVAFANQNNSRGLIAVSEIPSALRDIGDHAAMGYAQQHFEWVLGPSERFTSEPVFLYAYSGKVEKTISGTSTPLDRTVEGQYKRFLEKHIGIAADTANIPAPLWCSWSNFGPHISDKIITTQADLAAKAGFVGFQIDDGWQRGRLGTETDTVKFPDFDATCKHIRSLGLRLGLWVSCFRDLDSKDLKAMPNAQTLPEIKRQKGVGMSFTSPWRDYYANDLVYLHDRYGATYFKQDFSNIRFGDIAEGHESRTKKESLLRGLRGLLQAQHKLSHLAPNATLQITHEIYWGTPGVPCDIAVLKAAASYHIPPNDYSGVGWWGHRRKKSWKDDPVKLHKGLIEGCYNARKRFYAHRGLPLYCIEYYAAATFNANGSLTTEVQDRQLCSWLMGAPLDFAGDLTSLTAELIDHYRKRFELVKKLQSKYDIYRHFQYSGVPAPTDTDWHWWGKLNEAGCGAVVVIRGNGGEPQRRINIPWVTANRKYRVKSLLEEKTLGTFTGRQLQNGQLKLTLPIYGQEILELATP